MINDVEEDDYLHLYLLRVDGLDIDDVPILDRDLLLLMKLYMKLKPRKISET